MPPTLIVIDPGHGGNNHGAEHDGLVEKELTLDISKRAALQIHHEGTPVELTRYEDEPMTFAARGAASRDASLVLCIHVNAGAHYQHGAECYYWPGNMIGLQVSRRILNAMPAELQNGRSPVATHNDPTTETDDWLERPRRVLACHRPTAVLVEVAYMSNTQDREKYLRTDAGRSEIACAIVAGALRAVRITP